MVSLPVLIQGRRSEPGQAPSDGFPRYSPATWPYTACVQVKRPGEWMQLRPGLPSGPSSLQPTSVFVHIQLRAQGPPISDSQASVLPLERATWALKMGPCVLPHPLEL